MQASPDANSVPRTRATGPARPALREPRTAVREALKRAAHALPAAALLGLAACNQAAPPKGTDATAKWTDPETGCVYLVYGDGMGQSRVGSLSIRFRRDGTPDCPGGPAEQTYADNAVGVSP